MAVTSSIPKGTILSGKYKVGRELGRGGMAAVYRATNVDIDKHVAIKLLAGHLSTSSTVVERFLREARAVSKIKSPHICDVFDSGRLEDGTPFLVMELLEGESLYDAMCRDRQMSPELTLSIILQVSRGLSKAHEQQIVHRDLKPENIFLTVNEDGHLLVKILDFGLAKFYDPIETTKGKGKHARLTREGAVFGTPAYMSPEQVRGQAAADTRADLWALACITYECVTGTTVWSTEDGVAMTFAQIATAPLPDPRAYRPDLPESFTQWFQRALDRNIDARFQTVRAFADALAAAFDYRSSGGGLDSRLVDQITLHATDPNAVTQRRSKPSPPKKAPPPPPSKGRPPPPPQSSQPSSSPQRSASPSPVSLQEHPSIPPEAPPSGVFKKVAGAALVVAAVVAVVLTVRKINAERPAPMIAKRFGDLSALVSHNTEQASGLKYEQAHPWLPHLRTAQAFISEGKYDEALGMLRRLNERESHPLLKNLIDQVDVASQGAAQSAKCLVTGYARPRRGDLLSQDKKGSDATAPSIVVGIKGAVMTWSDNRDGQRRAYAVPLDEDKLSNAKLPVDISPEGSRVSTPLLLPVPQRFMSMYSDGAGGATGIYLRWISADAVIDAAPVLVADKSPITFSTATRMGDGFVVAWAERRDSDAVDLYYRRFDSQPTPMGELVRLTDLKSRGAAPSEVRDIRATEQDGHLHFVYEYSSGQVQQIRYQRVAVDTKPPGLGPPPQGSDEERTLADEVLITLPTVKATEPSLACNAEGCFVAWTQTVQNGAGVAFIDGKTGKRQWHKVFTTQGRHPQLAVAPNGDAQIIWVEGQKIYTTSLSRDGVGPTSKVARVVGEHPPPVIAAGQKRGEWYVAFLDFESARREPYAARFQCAQ